MLTGTISAVPLKTSERFQDLRSDGQQQRQHKQQQQQQQRDAHGRRWTDHHWIAAREGEAASKEDVRMRRRRGKDRNVSGIYVRTGNDNGNNNSSNSNAMLMDVLMIEPRVGMKRLWRSYLRMQ